MALGLSAAAALAQLVDLVTTYPYMQLHKTGEPGAAGTSNVATETDRQLVDWDDALTGATIVNEAQIQWTGVAGSEDYLYYSLWTLGTGGTFGHSGTITANPVTAGDTITFAPGDFVITANVAS